MRAALICALPTSLFRVYSFITSHYSVKRILEEKTLHEITNQREKNVDTMKQVFSVYKSMFNQQTDVTYRFREQK